MVSVQDREWEIVIYHSGMQVCPVSEGCYRNRKMPYIPISVSLVGLHWYKENQPYGLLLCPGTSQNENICHKYM